jgi:hypothetical protein
LLDIRLIFLADEADACEIRFVIDKSSSPPLVRRSICARYVAGINTNSLKDDG